MARTIQIKRGLQKNLPTLKPGEQAFTTDTKKVFIGSDTGNIDITNSVDVSKLATKETTDTLTAALAEMPSKEYIAQEIVKVNTGGSVDLSHKANVDYVNDLTGINNYSTVPIFKDGKLTGVEELDGTTVKKRTTITYNTDGSVNTVTDILEGKTIVSTMNYINGGFSSVSKQIIEGGL